jgi:hypothetical protein
MPVAAVNARFREPTVWPITCGARNHPSSQTSVESSIPQVDLVHPFQDLIEADPVSFVKNLGQRLDSENDSIQPTTGWFRSIIRNFSTGTNRTVATSLVRGEQVHGVLLLFRYSPDD